MAVSAIPVVAGDHGRYRVNVLAQGPSPDPDLVNGWGISRLPGSPWWVSDNGTDSSTLYKADGSKQALKVAIPGGAPRAPSRARTPAISTAICSSSIARPA